jgi:peptidoglycan/xylan/chitin deacetylase (PgdA/CDA1 family)
MSDLRYGAIRAAFELLAIPGISAAIRARSRARGVIFTLHRVLPEAPAEFSPNAILQVTPAFLDFAITRVRQLGIDIVSLDQALDRLAQPAPGKPFAVFTFDDGYRDNLVHALPVLRRHDCPFTLYLPTALVDGVGEVWWQALEDIIASEKAIGLSMAGERVYFPTTTTAEKQSAYDRIYRHMRQIPEPERVALIRQLAAAYGLDLDRHCRSLIMDWNELGAFAAERLCTIGAHTVKHYELAKLSEDEARREIAQSVDIIRMQFGTAPRHLSYPIGGTASAGPREYAIARELGLRSAVTTLPGGLYARHAGDLTALPRISLNGSFQKPRYVDVFATGAVFTRLGRVMK